MTLIDKILTVIAVLRTPKWDFEIVLEMCVHFFL